MKKLLNISVIAALAVLPLAANAVDGEIVAGDPAAASAVTPTPQADNAVTASASPKYALAVSESNDGKVVTAGYVKGAYNAAIKAINKVSETADNAVKGVQVNGTDLTLTNGKANVTIAQGSTNGTLAVNGTDVAVKGLGTAAYTASTDYATAAQGALADSAVQSVTTGDATSGNGTIKVDGTPVSVYGLGSAAYTDSTDYDAAGAASAVETKLTTGGGSTGYDINAKSLQVQGQNVLTATDLATYATQTGAAATAAAAVNGATIDLSGIQAQTGNVGGTATAAIPVMTTWGSNTPGTDIAASVDLSSTQVVTGLTGNTSGQTNKISAGTVSYTAGI